MITEWYEVLYYSVAGALLVAAVYFWLRERLQRRPRGGKMRIKVLRAENGLIDLSVNGEHRSYMDTRPQPLRAQDLGLLRGVLDASLMTSLMRSVQPESPLTRLYSRFIGQFRKREPQYVLGPKLDANCIRRCAISLNLGGTECHVLTPEMLTAIEEGTFGGTDGQV